MSTEFTFKVVMLRGRERRTIGFSQSEIAVLYDVRYDSRPVFSRHMRPFRLDDCDARFTAVAGVKQNTPALMSSRSPPMAQNATEYALVLPSWDQLNFSRNCTAFGQWLYSFITANSWDKQATFGGSVTLSLEMFDAAVPPDWSYLQNASDAQTATPDGRAAAATIYYGRVLQWFSANLFWSYNSTTASWDSSPSFSENVIWQPAVACPEHFCKAVAFTGNSDLSGIGVLISYLTEATLVTAYLICFTLSRAHRATRPHRRRHRHSRRHSHRHKRSVARAAARRLFDAVRGSLTGFLTNAMLFSSAILTAAVVMAAKQAGDNRSRQIGSQTIPTGSALYNPVLALLVGLFSVFPVAILNLLLPEHDGDDDHETSRPNTKTDFLPLLHRLRHQAATASFTHTLASFSRSIAGHPSGSRTSLRRVVLGILWGLAIAMVIVSPHSELDYTYRGVSSPADADDDNTFSDVLYVCDARGGLTYWHILDALPFLVVGVPLLWLGLTSVLYSRARQSPLHSPSAASPLPPLWTFASAWLCCVIMWVILISFVNLRGVIVKTAGSMDTDDEWAFGQVLAIATWAPVVADVIYLFVFGLEAGLAGTLPNDYTVRRIATTAVSQHVLSAPQSLYRKQQQLDVSLASASSSPYNQSGAKIVSAQQTSAERAISSTSASPQSQSAQKDPEKGR
ncbi:hypothetical protein CMQ_4103 [Grosmannia clavigera kw1407]|uniref:Uncharacterized protein n=1 Tax=Grosmannia clavigera (strain kw1407 / UAMH 11150) TaxID=655863 RepID=F0X8Q6_GROCL|nr:uncharacterized protein CMQ_4103 [Grosmannia clavigera kw1407]EFX06034.1 hypothetical protein CMQ_4103 [Grosmannia clavigera kw1407]